MNKLSIRLLMFIFILLCVFIATAVPALAYDTGDDYPNKDSCSGCHNTEYGDDHNDYNDRLFYYRQCTDFVAWCLRSRNGVSNFNNKYGGVRWGNAKNWKAAAESIDIDCDGTPAVGAIACWTTGSFGHVAWVEEVKDSTVVIEEYNWKPAYVYNRREIDKSNPDCYIHIADIETEEYGEYMQTGYDRVLPDGDYIIAACDNTKYYLDIQGYSLPAGDHDDVQLFYAENMDDIGACDVWTISYSGGFYTVRQKGTNMCLDVRGDGTIKGQDVQVFNSRNPSSDPATCSWAISRSSDNKAYHLQARSSGYYLDMEHGVGLRMNIQQWSFSTATEDQKWIFIPYMPAQPIPEGRYMLVTALDDGYIMDVKGDTGDVADDTEVRLWSDTADNRYNSFDVIPLANGYYKILHAASGKSLDVHGATLEYRSRITLYTDNGHTSQQWAIIPNGDGFTIWARCSGKVVDMEGYTARNGAKVFQYYHTGGTVQTWKFVPAEHTVAYDANGGSDAPEAQVKYYRNALTLSDAVPSRPGYSFLGWATAPGESVAYQPGDSYDVDADITLYAVWEKAYETVLELPMALTKIEDEAFANVAADAVVIPATVTEIGEGAFGDVVILGYAGTAAEAYADANGLAFIPLDEN